METHTHTRKMENQKTIHTIDDAKAYPSNMRVNMRYEDEDGDERHYSFDIDMDYVWNSDWLDDFTSAEEVNQEIEENASNHIRDMIPEGAVWDEDMRQLPLVKWSVNQEELDEMKPNKEK